MADIKAPGHGDRGARLLAGLAAQDAGPREPDIAFLRVQAGHGLEPVPLHTGRLAPDTPVAAVGYPAADPRRNDPALMDDIFGATYDVKRFSPGLFTGYERDGVIMLSDYSSLGGNSGSAVLHLDSAEAVGLRFAGLFRESNYAVSADIVAAALRRMSTQVAGSDLEAPPPTEATPAEDFDGRLGYDPEFLGTGELRVDLPGLGEREGDRAPVEGAGDDVLRYTHFSVIQSRSRRLPMLTAVNIDGRQTFPLKRKGRWRTDGRIQAAHQVGNELYRRNPLDRGHMVRRKDPGWGDSEAEAQQGELDTFHYTNAVPQHEDLNQRDWVGLEDYILEAADTRDFKVSVMTGPVFRDDDRTLRRQPGAEDIRIPQSFWKLAVMVNADTGRLSATAYLLTQGDLIRDLVEAAFVLGRYKTYQARGTHRLRLRRPGATRPAGRRAGSRLRPRDATGRGARGPRAVGGGRAESVSRYPCSSRSRSPSPASPRTRPRRPPPARARAAARSRRRRSP